MRTPDGPEWVPDARTVRWVFGQIEEREVLEGVLAYVEHEKVTPRSEGFWDVLARGAAKGTVFQLLKRAKESGTVFDDVPSE
jgi:hypothetical protein